MIRRLRFVNIEQFSFFTFISQGNETTARALWHFFPRLDDRQNQVHTRISFSIMSC